MLIQITATDRFCKFKFIEYDHKLHGDGGSDGGGGGGDDGGGG